MGNIVKHSSNFVIDALKRLDCYVCSGGLIGAELETTFARVGRIRESIRSSCCCKFGYASLTSSSARTN